ncbi:DUF397 domain-containing protein [Streptomyces sp. NPDC057376]|uniref:DUF397 domain-containing protein n=1 Tax=unclassified Streptomyces TaxID=2593676 RepID=UPI00093B539D|nr:DUF397 domain-containing protein [Streptomyces sp. CB02414]OKI84990.1 hypothetical protein AMK11_21830 [Streptomyces sp. CB02414]
MNRLPDLTTLSWRKSSYSDGGGTNCVEVADGCPDLVPVRDSKVPEGRVLVFRETSWALFVREAKKSAW